MVLKNLLPLFASRVADEHRRRIYQLGVLVRLVLRPLEGSAPRSIRRPRRSPSQPQHGSRDPRLRADFLESRLARLVAPRHISNSRRLVQVCDS